MFSSEGKSMSAVLSTPVILIFASVDASSIEAGRGVCDESFFPPDSLTSTRPDSGIGDDSGMGEIGTDGDESARARVSLAKVA
jgi:hypothetical protein